MLSRMLDTQSSFSERILLTAEGKFDVPQNVTELPGDAPQLLKSAFQMERSTEGLYQLAKQISEINPELKFSFKNAPDGKWIEYTVIKHIN